MRAGRNAQLGQNCFQGGDAVDHADLQSSGSGERAALSETRGHFRDADATIAGDGRNKIGVHFVDAGLQKITPFGGQRLEWICQCLVGHAANDCVPDAQLFIHLRRFAVDVEHTQRADIHGRRNGHNFIGRGSDPITGRGHDRINDGDDRFVAAGVVNLLGQLGHTGNGAAGSVGIDHDRRDVAVFNGRLKRLRKNLGRCPAGKFLQHVRAMCDRAEQIQDGHLTATPGRCAILRTIEHANTLADFFPREFLTART